MNLVQVSKDNFGAGLTMIGQGLKLDADNGWSGLTGLLGVIYATVAHDFREEAEIVDQMSIAYPWLGRPFHTAFLELLTGGDPSTHLVRKLSDGTYEIITVIN